MPNTAKGTPYVQGSDLVSAYPTVSSNLATHIDNNLAYNAATINAQTGTTYTFALADASAGKIVTATNASPQTYTVPPQSSVTWADGAVLRILNQGAGVVTIAAGAGVTISGTPLTLAQYKGAAIQRTASNTWTFIPFSGGVGNAVISDTPTGSYTGYQYWSFTASGTLNVGTAGFADILIIGGGGGGYKENSAPAGAGGGGAGGYLEISNAYLNAGALTVTVGAGGAGAGNNFIGLPGTTSRLGNYFAQGGAGGGGPAGNAANGYVGGSGSGAGHTTVTAGTGGAGTSGLGNNGGNGGGTGATTSGGGGGGAAAAGANGSSGTGGAGGAGSSNSYTGAAVTRGGGGGGGGNTAGGAGGTGGGGAGSNPNNNAVAGTANTGGGGGGVTGSGTSAAGGSGLVLIRVAV